MRTGLTWQGLRKQPWAFVGPFVTQTLAATLITGALGFGSSMAATRFAGAEQRALDASGIQEAAVVFVLLAVYLTMIIVGVTMTASIRRQARDIALVRAIGATPGQVRRAVAAQAAVVAFPAALLGLPVGALAGGAWVHGLASHGVIPARVSFHASVLALPLVPVITIATSVIGALVAATRPARVRPSVALTEVGAPRRRVSPVRVVIGLLLVGVGAFQLIVVTRGDPNTAVSNSFLVLLVLCVASGLLSPVLLRGVARLARLAGGTGAIAADSIAVRAPALSGALIPLLLAASFTLVKLVQHTTSEHVHGMPDPAADTWVDVTGTGVYVVFAAVAAVNTLVTVLLARRRELAVFRLTGATRAHALRVVICEAVVVTGTGLIVAAVVAGATLPPILHAVVGTWVPYVPAGPLVIVVIVAAALVALGMMVPAVVLLRRPAVESVAVTA